MTASCPRKTTPASATSSSITTTELRALAFAWTHSSAMLPRERPCAPRRVSRTCTSTKAGLDLLATPIPPNAKSVTAAGSRQGRETSLYHQHFRCRPAVAATLLLPTRRQPRQQSAAAVPWRRRCRSQSCAPLSSASTRSLAAIRLAPRQHVLEFSAFRDSRRGPEMRMRTTSTTRCSRRWTSRVRRGRRARPQRRDLP